VKEREHKTLRQINMQADTRTDGQMDRDVRDDLIIYSMLGYRNGTDNSHYYLDN